MFEVTNDDQFDALLTGALIGRYNSSAHIKLGDIKTRHKFFVASRKSVEDETFNLMCVGTTVPLLITSQLVAT